ncbi:Bacteriophage holin [compost metagenome]
MNKKRWRNYALWVSIVSQVLLLAQLIGHVTGLYKITELLHQDIMTIVNVILGILATLGIISNPTKPDSGGYNL